MDLHKPNRMAQLIFGTIIVVTLILAQPFGAAAQVDSRENTLTPAKELEPLADSLAKSLIKSGRLAGISVSVFRGTDTLLWKGWGNANLELGVPATPRTVYRVGSVSKQFTAALILRLASEDQLSLDNPVSQWIELPAIWQSDDPITLRHLLSHTSGIPSFTDTKDFTEMKLMDLTDEEIIGMVREDSLHFSPGSFFSYSNTGYYLLGMVVEKIMGHPFDMVLREKLLKPLGLEHTSYCWEQPLIENRADGYLLADSVRGWGKLDEPRLVNDPQISMTVPFSAGALCSSIGDLEKWTRALHGGMVIPDSLLDQMMTEVRLASGWGAGYGLGMGVTAVQNHNRLAHGGSIEGFRSIVSHYPEADGPEDDLTIAILANTRPFPLGIDRFEKALVRAAFDIHKPEVGVQPLPKELAARLSGSYLNFRRGDVFNLSLRDGRLCPPTPDRPCFIFEGIQQKEQGSVAIFHPEPREELRFHFVLPDDGTKSPAVFVPHYRFEWLKRVGSTAE